MTDNESELWNKISKFEFDQPTTTFTFAKRLAKDNGLTAQQAERIIEEYRKFIFLCCVSSGQMSPSHLVDQAWHLHLTYTRSYWIDLCKNTLGRDLHHDPTKGGDAESTKFKGLYKDTLTLYKRYFQTDPPRDIWPPENHEQRKATFEPHGSRNWIIQKPELGFRRSKATVALLLLTLGLLSLGCTSYVGMIPVVLGIVLLIGFVLWLVNRRRNQSDSDIGLTECGTFGCGSDSSDNHDTNDDSGGNDGGHSGDSGGSDSGGGDGGGSSGCGGGGCGGGGD